MRFSSDYNNHKNIEIMDGIFSDQVKSNSVIRKQAYVADTSLFSKEVFNPTATPMSNEDTEYHVNPKHVLSTDSLILHGISKAIDDGYKTLGRNKTKKILRDLLEKMDEEDKENGDFNA